MKKIREREIILGIQREMNSSAALMVDGEIISAVSEERFTNVKNYERYSLNAINVFKKTDLDGLILKDYFVEKIVK